MDCAPRTPAARFDPRLIEGLSVYQDVVLGGATVCRGCRDSRSRYELLRPHLPASGAVLDVGSNFAWFGVQLTTERPELMVASVEADWRSAAVQREVLAAHPAGRIALLTARAGPRLVRRFAAHGQRFDTALLLSVLHWIGSHRELLGGLGRICGELLIEHPDPREEGAGHPRILREIGPIGRYLGELFPNRPVVEIGAVASHRAPRYPRTLWWVGRPRGWQAGFSARGEPGLGAEALLELGLAWPSRRWWLAQCDAAIDPGSQPGRWLWTPAGLLFERARPGSFLPGQAPRSLGRLRRRVQRLGDDQLHTPRWRAWQRLRHLGAGWARRIGLRD